MPAERIASLLASATEILFALGLGDRVVAVSHECDYPAGVYDKPRVTLTTVKTEASSREIDEQVREVSAGAGGLYEIDVDRLAELRPDLIVTQSQCDVCAVAYDDVLRAVGNRAELAGTEVVDLNPVSLEAVLDDIIRVGAATGREDRAREYVESLEARVNAVRSRTEALSAADRPRVVCLEWIDPPMAAANWMPTLVEIAGGRNGLTTAGAASGYTEWNDVVGFDPEVMVVMPCGFDLERTIAEAATLKTFPGWSELAACRKGRVYAVDGNAYFNRSGPRIVDSIEILAGLFHPGLFEDTGGGASEVRRLPA